jgi:hypothetical protein
MIIEQKKALENVKNQFFEHHNKIVDLENYGQTAYNNVFSKLNEKYENLKYTSITMDPPTSSVHRTHIHISFSAYRAGKYTGPGGALTSFDNQSGPKSTIVSSVRQKLEQSNIGLEYQDKSYIKDDSRLTDLQVFELLYSIANLNAEIAAVFTALTYRETRNRPYSANKYGFFGLLQYGTRTKSGGTIEVDLLIPKKEKVKELNSDDEDKNNDDRDHDKKSEHYNHRDTFNKNNPIKGGEVKDSDDGDKSIEKKNNDSNKKKRKEADE